jgi:hypothetical protein
LLEVWIALPNAIPTTYGQNASSAKSKKDPSCNNFYNGPNLWCHVYGVAGSNPRLIAKSQDCITVTGAVLSIPKPITAGD